MRIALNDPGGQLIPLVEQLLLLLLVTDRRNLVADGDQLVLRLLPIALCDQLLNLIELSLCRKRHLIVADLFRRAEQHCPQPVQGIPRAGTGNHGTEPTQTQHRRRRRPDNAQLASAPPRNLGTRTPRPRTPRACTPDTGLDCGECGIFGNQLRFRRPAQFITPITEHRGEHRVGVICRRRLAASRQSVDERVAAGNIVERGLIAEIIHSRVLSPRFRT